MMHCVWGQQYSSKNMKHMKKIYTLNYNNKFTTIQFQNLLICITIYNRSIDTEFQYPA